MDKLKQSTLVWAILGLLLLPSQHALSTQTVSSQTFNANTSVETTPLPSFKLVGSANMKWLWFEIYEAKVLTPSGVYVANQQPLALELLYKRSISAEQLIDSTIDEWLRQKIDYQAEWVSILTDIWPNIEPQDQLILYVDESSVSHFFYNKRFIGSLNDTAFASAFSAIWLSENTLKPKLRNQLIGLNP